MDSDNKKLTFKKSMNYESDKKDSLKPNNPNRNLVNEDKLKQIIADKYNISIDDAEKVLKRVESNRAEKASNENKNVDLNQPVNPEKNNPNIQLNADNSFNKDADVINDSLKDDFNKNKDDVFQDKSQPDISNDVSSVVDDFDAVYMSNEDYNEQKVLSNELDFNKNKDDVFQDKSQPDISNDVGSVVDDFDVTGSFNNQKNEKYNEMDQEKYSNKNVDEIMAGIIPDYNKNLSIELKDVNLTFEVSNEKVDTIKESFIRAIKGTKSKKIEIHALKDISFKIYKGEKIGIIGYNGAGKSTLLNVITGIYPPDTGYVKTYGKISPLLSLGAGFDFNYSGRKNIFLNGAVLGYDKEYLESKVDEIIEFSELGEFIDIPIKNYSSGMLAKLGFSIATALEPDILIIDEILGVGDVNFKKKSSDKIKSLMGGGTTVLLVSHSIPQVRELCDKAIWIDKGNLREIGEVNKVCDHYIKDAEKASNEQLANIQFR